MSILGGLGLVELLTFVSMGKIPAMPRKSGAGWIPARDMHTDAAGFWHYIAGAEMIWPILFAMYLIGSAKEWETRRYILGIVLFVTSFGIAFSL